MSKSKGNTFIEIQPWGSTEYTVLKGSYTSFNTSKAKIDLITNPYYGRMLFIDGVLQSAESDEKLYHAEIVNCILPKGSNCPRNLLIAGGAEGALAKEIFSRFDKTNVIMVDWDETLVNHMKKETFAEGAFQNLRLFVIHNDILEYLKGSESFDAIILDLLDPHTDEEINWLIDVCSLCLQKSCNISINAGGDLEIKNKILSRLYKIVKYEYTVSSKAIFIPSFQQEWYLIAITTI